MTTSCKGCRCLTCRYKDTYNCYYGSQYPCKTKCAGSWIVDVNQKTASYMCKGYERKGMVKNAGI